MRKLSLTIGLFALAVASSGQSKSDYPITPVPFTKVHVADAFWAPRLETNRAVTIPFIVKKCEETGRIANFAIAGKLAEGKYTGERYNDTDVYKIIEAASYSLMVRPDPELDRYLDGVIAKIAAAQEPDGYLFTARTADPAHPQPGIGPERWVEETVSHELYNAGHLYEAAAAHFQATGKRTLLDIALRNADLVASVYGPDKRRGFPGHQEIELALVKLTRLTGKAKYLDLARYFLDQRGRDVKLTQYPAGSRFAIYNDAEQIQAHKPISEQTEALGHAVRLTYMCAGLADAAALSGEGSYLDSVSRLWESVVGRKMYLTAGVGSRHDRERFGADYELPNLTGYGETCASIGMALWNHRMFLLTGESKYLDVMERAIYNGVLAGVSLDGNAFFYSNPLESDAKFKFNKGAAVRQPWFGVACCPGNVARFLPSMPGYIYATKGDSLYVNLFIGGSGEVDLAGNKISIRQETGYPWDGGVRMVVDPAAPAEFTVLVRIPGWAQGNPVPTDLYRYTDAVRPAVRFAVNGALATLELEKGFARIRRTWKKGDTIDLSLPMEIRRVVAHPSVKDDAGKVALERGPLVYCLEGADNGGKALGVVLPDDAVLKAEFRPDLLKGVEVLTGAGLLAIPYHVWAHRGPNEMAVWLLK
jgi:uncharacterized protein